MRSNFDGEINAASGAGLNTNEQAMNVNKGSIVQLESIVSLQIFDKESYHLRGVELDIVFSQSQVRFVQVITTSGTGLGNISAAQEYDAVVKGYWKVGINNNMSEDLSSQASAQELCDTLRSLDGINHVNVARNPSSQHGWSWTITFFDNYEFGPPSLKVYGGELYTLGTAKNMARITIQSLIPFSMEYENAISTPLKLTDAKSYYLVQELEKIVRFNLDLFRFQCFGYWAAIDTFRLNSGIFETGSLRELWDQIRVLYVNPYPTKYLRLQRLPTIYPSRP